ncbi:MAG: hypothetical protein LLG14_25625 [Nocardiaceae bacterium]|nr:hypothetical protein [Nocardiaceae bacterium]
MNDIADHLAREDYDGLIATLREQISTDRRVLADPEVKRWCGQRWRFLFLDEAAKDERAVKESTKAFGFDGRPVKRRLAERFLAQDVKDWQLELPEPVLSALEASSRRAAGVDPATFMFCPGFVHRAIPVSGLEDLEAVAAGYGSDVVRADTHPARGCEANIADLQAAFDATSSDSVVMVGYSKGSADALTLLAHQPELANRVRALVSWAGAVGGSPSADGVYELIKDLELGSIVGSDVVLNVLKMLLPIAQMDGMIERPDEWDLRAAVRDLTTAERARFLDEHGDTIDQLDIPIFNIAGQAGPLEVPYFQMQGSIDIGRAVGPNDMQVAVDHAQVTSPMGTTLAVLRAHHWDLALGPFPMSHRLGSPNLHHPFPRRAALVATVQLLAELGLLD